MSESSPFSAERDEELGALLRDHLTGPNAERFVARLRTEPQRTDRDDSMSILGRWAKPGIMVAGIAAVALLWLGYRTVREEPNQRVAFAPVSEVINVGPNSGELLLATVLEGR